MFQILCSSVFLVVVLMTPGIADEHFPFLGEVVKESVNVRAGANTNFEKIDKLGHGAQVVVLAHQYEWYKVQLPLTAKAYLRADYLQINADGVTAQLIGDKVNVRALPNSESSSLGQLTKGVAVKVLEHVNGWCRIEPIEGIVGWVHQDFLGVKSKDVPQSLILKPVALPLIPTETKPAAQSQVKVKGVVIPLVPAEGSVRYALTVDGELVYLLEEGPKIASFTRSTVELEGSLVTDLDRKYTRPLIHITKIALVL